LLRRPTLEKSRVLIKGLGLKIRRKILIARESKKDLVLKENDSPS